jgi:glycosyltransferase involved in cell wall biosynthesis
MKQGILTMTFSTTGSLASYQQAGSYPLFLARLNIYADHFQEVHVCTFDTRDYTKEWGLANAFHHPMPPLPATSLLYHLLSPLIHRQALSGTTVIRTFNITGALPAIILRALTGARIFVSYGYSLPEFVRFQGGKLKYYFYQFIEKVALRRSNCIIVATQEQYRTLSGIYGRDKLVWIPNSVDTNHFYPGRAIRSDYLLFVGRFTAQKNLFTLLEAMAAATPQRPLKLVGQGEEKEALQAMAQQLGLAVEFMGVVPNDQLPAIYASAWAFVLPSHFEGMPKSLLEAMACSTPCLGSDVEGIRDILTDHQTGILVPPTKEGLAKGLRLLENEFLRNSIGKKARQYVVEHFSMEQVMAREISLLQGGQQ